MSEEQKVTTSEAKLPIRTLIAAIWLVAIGAIYTCLAICWLSLSIWGAVTTIDGPLGYAIPVWIFLWATPAVLPLISGILIFIRTPWAWRLSLIIFSIENLVALAVYLFLVTTDPYWTNLYNSIYIPLIVSNLLSLIIIIIDYKNYFRMLRKRDGIEVTKS